MANNPMQKKKIILIASIVAVLIVVVGVLLLKGVFSLTPFRQDVDASSLSAADKNGDTWALDMTKGPSTLGFQGGNATPGAPLLIKTDVQISGRDVSVGLILQGRAGETYAPGVRKNGQWLPEPGLRIVDEASKTLAAGKFKYG
jgi:hypothetical protein